MSDAINSMNLRLAFDDGPTVTVTVKQRDIARVEEIDPGFAENPVLSPKRSYLLAWVALKRMERQDKLPAGLTLPETVDAFIDSCDIEGVTDAEGNELTDQAPSTG